MLNRYETIMIYILGFLDYAECLFLRYFKPVCIFFVGFYIYATADNLSTKDIPQILIIVGVIGILTLVYKMLSYKERIRQGRRRK